MPITRPYRGVSAHTRRTERRASLLAACLDVIGRDGVAGTTVGAVCEQAGFTKRYFYESFADTDEILAAVLDELHASVLRDVREALDASQATALDRARRTVERLLAAMDDPRVARLYVEAPGQPVLQERRQRAYETYAELVAREINGARPGDHRAHLAALVFVTGTTQAVTSWLRGKVSLSRDELVEVLAQLCVGAKRPQPARARRRS